MESALFGLIPCTRHGEQGVRDERLIELLSLAQKRIGLSPVPHLRSLHYFNGQLWVTWKDETTRAKFARAVDEAWRELPEPGPTLHLVPSDASYDFQESVMNNADKD